MKIFFDVDGVLIDGWHARSDLRKPWDTTIEADLGVDRAAFQQSFFGNVEGRSTSRMLDCLTGLRDLKEALNEVLPGLGHRGNAGDFMRYWFEKDSNINAEVFELVRRLRERGGTQLFVATGQEHHRARYLWNELGFSKHFDRLFYSAELGCLKTDPQFFAGINRTLGIDADEQPLFFDDKENVVDLARRSGWDATVFTSARDIRDHPRLRHFWRDA